MPVALHATYMSRRVHIHDVSKVYVCQLRIYVVYRNNVARVHDGALHCASHACIRNDIYIYINSNACELDVRICFSGLAVAA